MYIEQAPRTDNTGHWWVLTKLHGLESYSRLNFWECCNENNGVCCSFYYSEKRRELEAVVPAAAHLGPCSSLSMVPTWGPPHPIPEQNPALSSGGCCRTLPQLAPSRWQPGHSSLLPWCTRQCSEGCKAREEAHTSSFHCVFDKMFHRVFTTWGVMENSTLESVQSSSTQDCQRIPWMKVWRR